MKKIRKYFFAWDFLLSAVLSGVLIFALDWPGRADIKLVLDISITTLSILFSMYFAIFSLLASTASNDFVLFLEGKENLFSVILSDFKFSMIVLFIALLSAILGRVSIGMESGLFSGHLKILISSFYLFALFYSVSVCASLAMQIIHFNTQRVRYLKYLEARNNVKSKDTSA